MAGTGYDWSAWSYVQLSAGDWDGDSSADDAIQTSDAIAWNASGLFTMT